jgi:hypothetical protein
VRSNRAGSIFIFNGLERRPAALLFLFTHKLLCVNNAQNEVFSVSMLFRLGKTVFIFYNLCSLRTANHQIILKISDCRQGKENDLYSVVRPFLRAL